MLFKRLQSSGGYAALTPMMGNSTSHRSRVFSVVARVRMVFLFDHSVVQSLTLTLSRLPHLQFLSQLRNHKIRSGKSKRKSSLINSTLYTTSLFTVFLLIEILMGRYNRSLSLDAIQSWYQKTAQSLVNILLPFL